MSLYKQECINMKRTLNGRKTFLNMVIHDLRSPASQINFAIEQAATIFKEIKSEVFQFSDDLLLNELKSIKTNFDSLVAKLKTLELQN